jgi:hypothetical protein
MIPVKDDSGFTLIEVLVGINITLITITIIVSFYLFSSKSITSFSSGTVARNELSTCLQKTLELVESAEYFEIRYNNNSCNIIASASDSIKINSRSLSVKDVYRIEDISDIDLKVLFNDGHEIVFRIVENLSPANTREAENVISSGDLARIVISFVKNKNKYSIHCTLPGIADRRFKNIGLNEDTENIY